MSSRSLLWQFFANGLHGATQVDTPTQGSDTLIDVTSAASVVLPSWDDSQGTIVLQDSGGTKRGIAWSSTGFVFSTNGAVTEQYPPVWNDPPHTPATTYYVDSVSGVDTNNGTSTATPWKTIVKVNGRTYAAGDEILFKCGSTWNVNTDARLNTPSDGSSGNYIKYGSYGTGAKPIFDGNNATFPCAMVTSRYIWLDNLDFNDGSGDPASGSDATLRIDGEPGAIGCVVTNCVVRNSGSKGVTVVGLHRNFRMKGCLIRNNATYGFNMKNVTGTTMMTGVVIADCEFYHNTGTGDGSPTPATNVIYGLGADARVYGCYLHDTDGYGYQIYRNQANIEDGSMNGAVRIHDCIVDGESPNIASWIVTLKGRGGQVYRCKLTRGRMACVQVCDDVKNTIGTSAFARCLVHHTVGADLTGGTPAYQTWSGAIYSASLVKTQSSADGDLYVWNNTFNDTYRGICDLDEVPHADALMHVEVVNNLITNQPVAATRLDYAFQSGRFDYNYYYNVNSTWRYKDVNKTFSSWQSSPGFDTNGTASAGNPLYVDTSNANPMLNNYALQAGSPAKGTGTDAVPFVSTDPNSWIGINYVPHATSPDAGAYQYLQGKTLNFSKRFLGVICTGNAAARFRLWNSRKSPAELLALTAP